jgi:hypothetical protein
MQHWFGESACCVTQARVRLRLDQGSLQSCTGARARVAVHSWCAGGLAGGWTLKLVQAGQISSSSPPPSRTPHYFLKLCAFSLLCYGLHCVCDQPTDRERSFSGQRPIESDP